VRPVSRVGQIQVEHTLPFELSADELGTLVDVIGTATDETGTSSLVGRTFSFSSKNYSGRRMEVRVTAARGPTHILIQERFGRDTTQS